MGLVAFSGQQAIGVIMRILFVLHTYPPESWGGTELHVRGLARTMAGRHEVRVFCRGGDQDLPDGQISRSEEDGIPVTWFNNLYHSYAGFEWTYRNEAAHEAFISELDEYRPDVVHIHHLTGLSTSIVEAAKRRGIPVVFSLHDFWMVCPRGQRLAPDLRICEDVDRNRCYSCLGGVWPQWFDDRFAESTVVDRRGELSPALLAEYDRHMAYILDLCDVLVAPSAFHRDRMVEMGAPDDRSIACAHGLDHELIPGKRRRGPVKVIGYIGSVIPIKGVHVLLDAFRLLHRGGIELQIWGGAPEFHERADYLRQLRELSLGIDEGARFMGPYDHDDLGRILADIDILVVPSLWWETFSLTIREAMLAGVPVIASDLGAMREALTENQAGLLFPAGDARALADTMARMIDDDGLRARSSNYRRAVKTAAKNAEDYLGIYDKAKRSAKQRRDSIRVAPSSFPKRDEERPETSSSDARRRSSSSTDLGDIRFDIDQFGGEDLNVTSALARGDAPRLEFVVSYGNGPDAGEVRLGIEFDERTGAPIAASAPSESASLEPAEEERDSLSELPSSAQEASSAAESMMRSQSSEFDLQQRERAMYMLESDLVRDQVKALDAMVESSTLSEDEQVIESTPVEASPPRRRRQHGDAKGSERGAPRRQHGDVKEDGGSEKSERGRSGRDRGGRARGRDEEGGRSRDEGRGKDRGSRNEGRRGDRADAGRKERDSSRRGGQEPRKRRDGSEDSTEGRRDKTPRDEGKPRSRQKAEGPSERPRAKQKRPDPKRDEMTFWDEGKSGWALPKSPEKTEETTPSKRAPNHRLGAQPGTSGASKDEPRDFGDGV